MKHRILSTNSDSISLSSFQIYSKLRKHVDTLCRSFFYGLMNYKIRYCQAIIH